jgi:GT2 family glycosyltransferase
LSLSIVVPVSRPRSLQRLLASIEQYAPPSAETILILQCNACVPDWAHVIRAEPSFPAPLRRLGATHAQGDYLLFLDDDHELRPEFASHWRALQNLADQPALVSLPIRRNRHPRPRIVAMCGGMLLTRAAYTRAGGHGDDYLDDVELCLRCKWAGIPIIRYHTPVTVHHYGERGGLRDLPDVQPKRTAHLRLSQLAERYSDKLIPDPRSWWGFKEIRHDR